MRVHLDALLGASGEVPAARLVRATEAELQALMLSDAWRPAKSTVVPSLRLIRPVAHRQHPPEEAGRELARLVYQALRQAAARMS